MRIAPVNSLLKTTSFVAIVFQADYIHIVMEASKNYPEGKSCDLKKEIEKLPDELRKLGIDKESGLWEEQTLKVEEELRLEFQKQSDLSFSRFSGYVLQKIALSFMEKLYTYPLDSEFPKLPGVYFIYHDGKTQLYEGSKVVPSTSIPVYVGMSKTNIGGRLKSHRNFIRQASNEQTKGEEQSDDEQKDEEEQSDGETDEGQTGEKLTERRTQREREKQTGEEQTERGPVSERVKMKLSDFVVRFMILDIKHYASCIESMLIEHFCPVWNSETVKLSFGNANNPTNNWRKYHINNDPDTIKKILGLLTG